ncbi:regulator of microtubule dynamics protein 1-like isoform X3 [Acropora palmata]|uniref:regulator of microtubule dynamics protein 1-like isoform X3 n=1 Tax=Acropora palmata TaxID=6131 RepID=UPI003DA15EE8
MASLFSIFDFTFSLSLGRNILFGVSIGLGIGVGIGVGMVASKRIFPFRADDRNLVVLFSELTNEIREIRYVMLKLETSFDKGKSEGIRILKEKGSEDEETDDFEEFFEMSVEEPLQSSPEVDDLKAVLDEVDALRSSDNTEDKYKVHGILENSLQKDQQSCDVTWRYARSCFDIATLKGKNGDFEGKRTLLYEGVAKAERALKLDSKSSVAHKWYAVIVGSTSEFEPLPNQIMLGFKYKEHIQKAIELDGSDPCLYHYLGRWCFEVSMLSWWKRTAAATLVAEPPSSTLDEALGNFLKAEEIQPGFWLSNLYWIGKCHYEKGNSQIAADYLKKALALPVSSDDDRESYNLSRELLSSLRL